VCQDTADTPVHMLRRSRELQGHWRVSTPIESVSRLMLGGSHSCMQTCWSTCEIVCSVCDGVNVADFNVLCHAVFNICRCVDTPCKACKRCLTDFSTFVRDPAVATLVKSELEAAFRDYCVNSAGREPAVCDMARLGIASSFRGNAGKRAGAICTLLSECNSTIVSGC
jgi:hypothetical protein